MIFGLRFSHLFKARSKIYMHQWKAESAIFDHTESLILFFQDRKLLDLMTCWWDWFSFCSLVKLRLRQVEASIFSPKNFISAAVQSSSMVWNGTIST